MTKHIFITGSGHSGSTLVDLILGAHSKIFSIGEIKQWERYIHENKYCSCEREVVNCPFWKAIRERLLVNNGIDIFTAPEKFRFFIDSEHNSSSKLRYWSLIAAAACSTASINLTSVYKQEQQIATHIYTLYNLVSNTSGKPIVVDSSKSPLLMKLLWLKKPKDFKAIYLVRDGRAVLNSNLRKNKKLLFAVKGWIKGNRLVTFLSRTMGSNILLVRYEDICRNPEKEIKRICLFIGIDFEPDMLMFTAREIHNIDGNRMRFSKDNTIRLDEKWRRELNNEALNTFNKYAKKVNERFGYE